MNPDEFNRLISLGFSQSTALSIQSGDTDEQIAKQQLEMSNKADQDRLTETPQDVTPLWNLEPEYFYLWDDGASQKTDTSDLEIISITPSSINKVLYEGRQRKEGNWSTNYKSKTRKIIAFWQELIGLTPPRLTIREKKLIIAGGNHRFQLALEITPNEAIPFLIDKTDIQALNSIIKEN